MILLIILVLLVIAWLIFYLPRSEFAERRHSKYTAKIEEKVRSRANAYAVKLKLEAKDPITKSMNPEQLARYIEPVIKNYSIARATIGETSAAWQVGFVLIFGCTYLAVTLASKSTSASETHILTYAVIGIGLIALLSMIAYWLSCRRDAARVLDAKYRSNGYDPKWLLVSGVEKTRQGTAGYSEDWHCLIEGQQFGPLTKEQIGILFASGVIDGHTKVRRYVEKWQSAYHTELTIFLNAEGQAQTAD